MKPSVIKRFFFPFTRLDFSGYLFTAPSPEVKNRIAGAFRVDTGYPRNDLFYRPGRRHLPITTEIKEMREKSRVGIYLPTHRAEGKTEYLENMIPELKELDSSLKEMSIILLIKQHFYHQKPGEKDIADFSNIRFISDKDIEHDIHAILPFTDFLITDYSSILFDYLLLNKPVIFLPFDLDAYTGADREFYYDYDTITPGPVAKNWNDLADKLKDILENPESFSRDREEVLNKFNSFKDGESSARVFEEITDFLN
jgi:CDP-glycerol glycerophosphotransferase (TagB/SpsB family)